MVWPFGKEYWLLEKIDFEDLLIRPKSMLKKMKTLLRRNLIERK